jgi:hypothetical protein
MAKGGPTEVDAFDLLQALKEHWENTENEVKLLRDHADYLEKEIKIAMREGQELGQRPRERVNELEEDISSMEYQVRAACALLLAAVRDLCARVSARALPDGHPGTFSERREEVRQGDGEEQGQDQDAARVRQLPGWPAQMRHAYGLHPDILPPSRSQEDLTAMFDRKKRVTTVLQEKVF